MVRGETWGLFSKGERCRQHPLHRHNHAHHVISTSLQLACHIFYTTEMHASKLKSLEDCKCHNDAEPAAAVIEYQDSEYQSLQTPRFPVSSVTV